MSKDDIIIKPKDLVPDTISSSVTWLDGRIIFRRHNKKWAKFFFGICSFSGSIFAVTPRDYERPLMITTIKVSPSQNFCERAYSCLNFTCRLNRFDKNIFINEFKDCGGFTLGLPKDLGSKPLWFSEGDYTFYWRAFIIPESGGILRYNPDKDNKIIL